MARPKDETYIIDLCDDVLGIRGLRGYNGFSFLVGDVSRRGAQTRLPVDAYYEPLKLVVEYQERQHYEAVLFFDRRIVASGVTRGEQRKKYDLLRVTTLPKYGIGLVVFCYRDFAHDAAKRLRRIALDRDVVKLRLEPLLDVSRTSGR